MGAYACLRVGSYPLGSTKSDVDPTTMMLFTEGDKRVRIPTPVEWARYTGEPEEVVEEQMREGGGYDERPYAFVEYAAGMDVLRDRLDFMGYTLPRIRREFAECMEEHVCDLVRSSEEPCASATEDVGPKCSKEIQLLSGASQDLYGNSCHSFC